MKTGKLTPLDHKFRNGSSDPFTNNTFEKKPSVFDQADKMFKYDTSRYEVSYSPERQTLIDSLKIRRRMKMENVRASK